MYTIIRRGNERNARQVYIDSSIIAQYHSPGDVFRSKLHFRSTLKAAFRIAEI
jgi:hypothetical protein